MVIYGLGIGGAAAGFLVAGHLLSGNVSDGLLVVGYPLAFVGLIGLVRTLFAEVAFEPARMTIRNPLTTRHIAWSEIVDVAEHALVAATHRLGARVRLRLRDGTIVRVGPALRLGRGATVGPLAARLRHAVLAERAFHHRGSDRQRG